jgi:hypothetical protein
VTIVCIEEEVNSSLGLLKTNYMPINQEVVQRQQIMKKLLYSNQPQAQDELKDVGG